MYETSDLAEFLTNAEIAGRDFTAARDSAVIVGEEGFVGIEQNVLKDATGPMHAETLQIPKRPRWTKEMTPEEMSQARRMAEPRPPR